MQPSARQKKIQDLLQTRRNLKISELSSLLGVSEMTIHRDIKPLIEQGIVIKTFGGITIAQKEEQNNEVFNNTCVFCGRIIQQRLSYRLILSNNKVESACCAHCGLLRHEQLNDQVLHALCYDFLFDTTISASSAWFVIDTPIDIGCCHPQVLTFCKREHAEGFVKGFGGYVIAFHDALETVHRIIHPALNSCCSCGSPQKPTSSLKSGC